MASLAQSVFLAKTLLMCAGQFLFSAASGSGSPSKMVGVLIILVVCVVFLLPFDRRIIERYIMRIGAESAGAVGVGGGGSRSGKLMMDYGFSETAMTGGPYTRQLCKMLDLEVVSFARRKFFVGCCLVELAIGRWNEKAREFEVVTEWCETWEDLEEEARQAMKSFQGTGNPKYRGASNV